MKHKNQPKPKSKDSLIFSTKDFRGKDFRGQNLAGADFSNSYIQGANFTGTKLVGSNFTGAKAGVKKIWLCGFIFLSFSLSGIAGFIWSFTGVWTFYLFKKSIVDSFTLAPGVFVSFILIALCFLSINKGLGTTLGVGTSVLAVAGTSSVGIAVAFSGAGTLAVATAGNGSLAVAGALAGLISGTLSISTAFVLGNIICRYLAIGISLLFTFMLASALGARVIDAAVHINWASKGAILGGTLGIILSNFLASKILLGDEKHLLTRNIISTFCTVGGTCFRNADLTDANLQGAYLKGTNFVEACLIRTNWLNAQRLSFIRSNAGYLKNPQICKLMIGRNGQDQSFDGLNLTGVNLRYANLRDASFIGASLNQSDLSGADLSRATLKQTQLDGADLTGAILTGACIEDWGITSTTKLENVQCDYIFMRTETKDNPNRLRKPDNWRENFADGEFADFIQPFFDTLDLYHSQDVDPRAISIALKSLADAHPDDDLQFVAMERRGKNGLNLRFTTAPKANKSELSHEYFANYAQIKKELPVAVQMRIAEQDAEIRTLKGTIEQFILTGTHQSNIQANTIQVIQGELVMTENKGININAGDNANISGLSSGDGIVNLGTISGNVTNSINQLPDSPESNEPDLKALLTQLQQIIEADTDLPDPDKADLLEQVQSLAEAKQVEEPVKRESIARKAMKIFDATLKSLPDTARIVEACSKLLPLVLTALGLAV